MIWYNQLHSPFKLQMITPIRIPYIEKELGISIPCIEGFENEKGKKF